MDALPSGNVIIYSIDALYRRYQVMDALSSGNVIIYSIDALYGRY